MSDQLLGDDLRRELVDYYKWVASLAVFVLSTSLALANLLAGAPHKWLLTAGWLLLSLTILVNWLLVKSLISGGTVAATPVDEWTWKQILFTETWISRLKIFGVIQQAAFVTGSALIALAYVLRIFEK